MRQDRDDNLVHTFKNFPGEKLEDNRMGDAAQCGAWGYQKFKADEASPTIRAHFGPRRDIIVR